MSDGPFPAVVESSLGDYATVQIDKAVIPYLLGSIDGLCEPDTYNGDFEDIAATVNAFEELIAHLSAAL